MKEHPIQPSLRQAIQTRVERIARDLEVLQDMQIKQGRKRQWISIENGAPQHAWLKTHTWAVVLNATADRDELLETAGKLVAVDIALRHMTS